METVTLYTRAVCGLCDDMKRDLEQRGYRVLEVDIDGDPELERRYGWDVPVAVLADGTELARHRLDSPSSGSSSSTTERERG